MDGQELKMNDYDTQSMGEMVRWLNGYLGLVEMGSDAVNSVRIDGRSGGLLRLLARKWKTLGTIKENCDKIKRLIEEKTHDNNVIAASVVIQNNMAQYVSILESQIRYLETLRAAQQKTLEYEDLEDTDEPPF
jgi:gas vesicle protein